MGVPSSREQRRAAARAAAKVARAGLNPVEVAHENQKLRNSVKGAHALVHVLTRRLAGWNTAVSIPREQWMSLPPGEDLDVSTDDDGNVTLVVKKE
jgi:hypothetical protein